MEQKSHYTNPFSLIIWLTGLFILGQLAFFLIHYTVSDLIDTLVSHSITRVVLSPAVLIPLLEFIVMQLLAYVFFVAWIGFISLSLGALFQLPSAEVTWLSVLLCLAGCTAILTLNAQFFPNSFFAIFFIQYPLLNKTLLCISCLMLLMATFLAYCHYFYFRRYLSFGSVLLGLALITCCLWWYQNSWLPKSLKRVAPHQPNIIIIGLDSLRPDFIGFFGNKNIKTPAIDHFLEKAVVFTQAYTPLARTFPSWISILTGKYPNHNGARVNIADPNLIVSNKTLAKELQQAGYETIYGTDEPRFTDINEIYGFDKIVGPRGGVVEFFLGGLADFPLTNLLINLPFGIYLFPYNYGNRGADITYLPNSFLHQLQSTLARRGDKPLFLALHLCLSHWPYTWATQHYSDETALPEQYARSVTGVDAMLADLLEILKKAGLFENSLVLLVSDHGASLGLLGDRVIDKKNYLEDPKKLQVMKLYKLSSAAQYTMNFKRDYSLSTSYGAGTDVLSLKQYHVLMAYRYYFNSNCQRFFDHKKITGSASLLDIAPTVLDFLQLPALPNIDGYSLLPNIVNASKSVTVRPLFIETADTFGDLETDKIFVEKILQQAIGIYLIDAQGRLIINPEGLNSIIKAKQRAIIAGDWLLARYPDESRFKLSKTENQRMILKRYAVLHYFVLVNLQTGRWTLDMDSELAKQAPLATLKHQLKAFYGDEI